MGYHIAQISAATTWPLRHRVMWPDKPLDYIKLAEDNTGLHYGLFLDEQLVSVISLFINGEQAQFRKFATEVTHQGQGYGSKLLKHLIQETTSRGIKKLWCNARKDKCSYYERFGLTKTDQSFTKGGIAYVILIKNFIHY